MARRILGQEHLDLGDRSPVNDLNDLDRLVDWASLDEMMSEISSAARGELGWPPLALFKALLLARWYDLSDVRLAEMLDAKIIN